MIKVTVMYWKKLLIAAFPKKEVFQELEQYNQISDEEVWNMITDETKSVLTAILTLFLIGSSTYMLFGVLQAIIPESRIILSWTTVLVMLFMGLTITCRIVKVSDYHHKMASKKEIDCDRS